MDKIKELTTQIKQYSYAIKQTFFSIGKSLILLKEAFKGARIEFEEHCKKEFEFGIKHVYKFIQVYEKFGKVASMRQMGISKLILLIQVPDEKIDEFIELAEKTTTRELDKQIKASGIGRESTYSSTLNPKDRKEDFRLRLIRQLSDTLKNEFDKVINDKESCKANHLNWLESAVRIKLEKILIDECKDRLEVL